VYCRDVVSEFLDSKQFTTKNVNLYLKVMPDIELPPLDSRTLDFNVEREIRRTLVDFIRGDRPTTILGLLIAQPEGVSVAHLAEQLDEPMGLVNWSVERLEDEDLCMRVVIDGVASAVPLAGYTERNA
jgi:hypothetical protein